MREQSIRITCRTRVATLTVWGITQASTVYARAKALVDGVEGAWVRKRLREARQHEDIRLPAEAKALDKDVFVIESFGLTSAQLEALHP